MRFLVGGAGRLDQANVGDAEVSRGARNRAEIPRDPGAHENDSQTGPFHLRNYRTRQAFIIYR